MTKKCTSLVTCISLISLANTCLCKHNNAVYMSLITESSTGSKTRTPEDRAAWRSQNRCWAKTHSSVISQCKHFLITLAGHERHSYFSSAWTLLCAAPHDNNSHRTIHTHRRVSATVSGFRKLMMRMKDEERATATC